MSDFINDLSVFGFTLLASILLVVFVFILRMTDKDYRKQFSKDEKIKKLEENIAKHNAELNELLPKVDPLEKEELQSIYGTKENREIETNLNLLNGRITTLQRFIKTDENKLQKLKDNS